MSPEKSRAGEWSTRCAEPLRRTTLVLTLALVALPRIAAGQQRMTLPQAIAEAMAANAHLPLPALDIRSAGEREKEARAEQWLKVALEGDFIYAPPGYAAAITNLGEARLQGVVRQPIYAGGALRAGVARAGAGLDAARAKYRVAQKDLELDVRSRFSELQAALAELESRRAGLEQLGTYRTALAERQAAGQGVAADLGRTDVRIALEQDALVEVESRADEARLALNDLMGRDPAAPLEIEPLPDPPAVGVAGDGGWEAAPDIGAAEAAARSAAAELTIARAELRPRLLFSADAGFLADDTTHPFTTQFWDRLWRDGGYSLSLVFAWPVWDTGAMRARAAEAGLGLEQARLRLEAEKRDARLNWEKARAARDRLRERIEILSRAVPDARDAYLQAESRYRGGLASALDVLEAHRTELDAAVLRTETIARYRVAEAVLRRWGTP